MTLETFKGKRESKVVEKLKFYDILFRNKIKFIDPILNRLSLLSLISDIFVVFVYNGANFFDISKQFKSTNFVTGTAHMPLELAVTWLEHDQRLSSKSSFMPYRGYVRCPG